MTIEQRLMHLERSMHFWRKACLLLGIMIAAACLFAAKPADPAADRQRDSTVAEFQTIRCRELVVWDEEKQIVAVLAPRNGGGRLELVNAGEGGKAPSVLLFADGGSAAVSLLSGKTNCQAGMAVYEAHAGSATVGVWDRKNYMAMMSVRKDRLRLSFITIKNNMLMLTGD